MKRTAFQIAAGLCLGLITNFGWAMDPIVVGSKNFNEGYILAEIISQILEDRGTPVERKFGLGGTMVCYQALRNGEIDVYPEYSGTLQQAVLKLDRSSLGFRELADLLRRDHGLDLLDSFGFNNTYVLAVRGEIADRLDLRKISDLRSHPQLRFGFSHEFLNRRDGWIGLAQFYGFARQPIGIEHGFAYQAVADRRIDVMDAYSTDAKIETFDLALLEDDRRFFPTYMAAPLLRGDLDPRIGAVLSELAGTLDEREMRQLNGEVVLENRGFAEVAGGFLWDRGLVNRLGPTRSRGPWARR